MKRSETAMQRFLLTILLAGSLVGFVKAQEDTGDAAEKVKKEIMKLEHEKTLALEKGVSGIVDWFSRVNADDLVHVDPYGERTKAQCIAAFESGKVPVPCKAAVLEAHGESVPDRLDLPGQSLSCLDYYDYRVRVYGSGNTAILTYH